MNQDDEDPLKDPKMLEKLQRLNDMFPEEELDPALKPYVTTINSLGWPALQHPLVYQVPYHEMENHRLNEYYRYKKEQCVKALDEGKYEKYIFLHERPYRLNAFDEVEHDLDDDQYWELLSGIWVDTENFWQNVDLWKYFWDASRPGREKVMDEDEKKIFDALPAEFVIYRGFTHEDAETGLSWTLDKKKAQWFAKRFSSAERDAKNPPKVASTKVSKDLIYAYLDSRGEKEIVVDPERFINPVKIELL